MESATLDPKNQPFSTLINNNDAQYQVIKRNGKLVAFDPARIVNALTRAFMALEHREGKQDKDDDVPDRIQSKVADLTEKVIESLGRRMSFNGRVHIEDIQDQVELMLMRGGEHKVARDYVLYREAHAQQRADQPERISALHIIDEDGQRQTLDEVRLYDLVTEACKGLEDVDPDTVVKETLKNLYDGAKIEDVNRTLVMCSRVLIEKEPNYSQVTARLLLDGLRSEALHFVGYPASEATAAEMNNYYANYFKRYIKTGIEKELLSPLLAEFDLERIGAALDGSRDMQFTYLGLQTLYDRYFLHWDKTRFELPQAFFMRVAMGLSINEIDRESAAVRFYNQLSSFDMMSSTPTLFNSGTLRPQLSSCYLTTIPDDLDGIFNGIRNNALLSKFAGGLGNDWSNVRAMGSRIKGTNGQSQGVIPFLKVANDTLVACNQGGRRKGSGCAYLETWHLDIEEFLELRKNTGDERRRTHDMNTANWIPDLFMKRVHEDKEWTLFSPSETPDLHTKYGKAFDDTYHAYEQQVEQGKIKIYKKINAVELWRKMLTMLFETGHPWLTFKDVCNIRSPQQHVGTVHSSNLCTEITLNTSEDEIAVCNLASVNLPQHITKNGLDMQKLERTVTTAIRMLDNVIDINYYAVPEARTANMRHRAIGLGMMGFQDALQKQRIPYESKEAIEFADSTMEAISYFAIKASSELAAERGAYSSFQGSLWHKGILPIDSLKLLAAERGDYLQIDHKTRLDWDGLRKQVQSHGMRNSNCMAIAPTATISNICGVSQSIEPAYRNLYVKSNLSGEFTVINPHLVEDLKRLNLWDETMINDLKYFDGSIQHIDRIPEDLKALYATAFELNPHWLIDAAARRQKWIDQAQSLNLYMLEPSGKRLDALYKHAWLSGLKTTYYLRSQGATTIQRHRHDDEQSYVSAPKACSIDDPDCEACQ